MNRRVWLAGISKNVIIQNSHRDKLRCHWVNLKWILRKRIAAWTNLMNEKIWQDNDEWNNLLAHVLFS